MIINHSFLKTVFWKKTVFKKEWLSDDQPLLFEDFFFVLTRLSKIERDKKKFNLFTSVYLLYYCKKNHWTWILFTIIRGPDVLDLVPRSLGDETPAKTTAYNSGEEELMLVYLQPNKKKDENRGIEMSRWDYDG